MTEIPVEVAKRCYGKQTPITPHSQRLLVAAAKEAKVEKGSKGAGKGKPKAGTKPKAKPKSKPQERDTGSDGKKKSAYAQEKDKYIGEFLGTKICTATFSQIFGAHKFIHIFSIFSLYLPKSNTSKVEKARHSTLAT